MKIVKTTDLLANLSHLHSLAPPDRASVHPSPFLERGRG